MKIRYFAWIRERIGKSSETYEGFAETTDALIDELENRGGGYSAALSDRNLLRIAIDQELVNENTSIKNATEVAIFPPMTGG